MGSFLEAFSDLLGGFHLRFFELDPVDHRWSSACLRRTPYIHEDKGPTLTTCMYVQTKKGVADSIGGGAIGKRGMVIWLTLQGV